MSGLVAHWLAPHQQVLWKGGRGAEGPLTPYIVICGRNNELQEKHRPCLGAEDLEFHPPRLTGRLRDKWDELWGTKNKDLKTQKRSS